VILNNTFANGNPIVDNFLKKEFNSEKMKGLDSLIYWPEKANEKYEKEFRNTSTIVIIINSHGSSLDTLLEHKNISWYSPRPFRVPLRSKRGISKIVTTQLLNLYDWATMNMFNRDIYRIKSGKVINHYKILQKFLLTRLYENVTINDAIMDVYHHSTIKRKDPITINKFNELIYDKNLSGIKNEDNSAIKVCYMSPINSDIVNDKTLLIEENGVITDNIKLSTLIDKLRGKKPFINEHKKEIFVNFDNIFIYDFSCNSSMTKSDKLCYSNLMKGDLQNKHTSFDYNQRVKDIGITQNPVEHTKNGSSPMLPGTKPSVGTRSSAKTPSAEPVPDPRLLEILQPEIVKNMLPSVGSMPGPKPSVRSKTPVQLILKTFRKKLSLLLPN
jgi:hypothetical protein